MHCAFIPARFVSMREISAKLLLWLLAILNVAELVHLENSCPEYAPYYCACSWDDIAEVKQLRMCLYGDFGKGDCHPCPEGSQENVNCDSCDDDVCPICSPLNFGGTKPLASHLKQPIFLRLTRNGSILYARPFSLQDYHGFQNSDLENTKYHPLYGLKDSNNQTDISDNILSRLQDSYKRYSQVQIKENVPANARQTSSNLKDRREKWLNFPKHESSRMHHKKHQHSEVTDDIDFKAKSFSVVEERKNAKPFELPLWKYHIPDLTLSEKKNEYANLNDFKYLESGIGKPKLNKGRKHTGKSKKKYLLHNLPSDKIKYVSFERFIDNEQNNLIENLEKENFILLLHPLDISDKGAEAHQNIPGKFKTHGDEKYYFRNIPDNSGMDNIQCLVTNESSKISFNDFTVSFSVFEEIEEDIQKCISDQSINVYDVQEKIQPFETSCNISLSQTLLFKCIGLEVGNDTNLHGMEIKETVKVYGDNFTDKIELVIEIANLSLEHLSEYKNLTTYNKTSYSNLNGKLNIEIRFFLKKSSDKNFSYLPDHEVFRKHHLSEGKDTKIEPYFIDNKFKINDYWMKKANLEEAMNSKKFNFYDSEGKKDIFTNTIDQENNKMNLLDFPYSLTSDNKVKLPEYQIKFIENNKTNLLDFPHLLFSDNKVKLPEYKIKFFDATENTDRRDNWEEEIYHILKDVDKETEGKKLLEDSTDEIKQPFDKLRESFFMAELPDAAKVTKSPNSSRTFPQKSVFGESHRFLFPRSLKDSETSEKIVMTHQSIVQLFSLEQNPVKSQNYSNALWFRFRKNASIPNINETVRRKNLKNSDIFKLFNVSISSLKKSKMYNTNCETCSVIYKIMLDSGFKNDLELVENVNSSDVVLMDKPQFVSYPHKFKVRTGSQNKSKTSSKYPDSFTIQMNINFLFLSSDDYKRLSRKHTSKNNPLRNSPWADMRKIFVFRIPDSFSSQSKILKLSRSLKRNNLKPVFKELLNQDEFNEEIQKILFAILSKIHEKKTKASIKIFSSTSITLPAISSGMTKFNDVEKSVNVKAGKSWLKDNLKEENFSIPFPTLQNLHKDHEEPTNKMSSNNISQHLKKSTEIAYTENLVKLKTDMHYVSETLKPENEKLTTNIGQKHSNETMAGAFVLKPKSTHLRKIRDNTENTLSGINGVRSLQNSGAVIRYGIAESENVHHREKRDYDSFVAIPHNNWCPIRAMRRNGHLDCTMWTFKKICTVYCHPGYSYNGKQNAEMSCSRRQNKWTVDVNKPCVGSGGEKPEIPDRGPAPRPPPVPGKGKLQPIPIPIPPANGDDNDDYYDEYEYSQK